MVVTGEELSQEQDHAHKEKLHTLVFSATLAVSQARPWEKRTTGKETQTSLDKVLEKLDFRRKVEVIDLTKQSVTVDTLVERKLLCLDEEKDVQLFRFLLAHRPGRVVIFANAISMVRRLTSLLRRLRICATRLHAGMQQRQRLKAIDHFRSHDTCILVASDVAARGLDIPDVAYIVHYNVPQTADLYVHRSGRTARAGQSGFSLALVGPKEARQFGDICTRLGKDILPLPATHRAEGAKAPPELAQLRPIVATAKALERELKLAASDAAKRRWLRETAEQLDVDIVHSDAEGEAADDVGEEGEEQQPDSDVEEAKRRSMAEWQQHVAELKEKLATLLCRLDSDGAATSARRGFGKRAIAAGTGLTTDKLSQAIEEARARHNQLAVARKNTSSSGTPTQKRDPHRAKRKNLKKLSKRK
jgi:ATP-dependent RNA helicase DDX24/MAK5